MPSSSTIKPMSCDLNSELVSEIGTTEEVTAAAWPGPGLVPPAAVAGRALATADGLISGNRLAAFPAGTSTVLPGVAEPMASDPMASAPTGIAPTGIVPTGRVPTGRVPTGRAAPRLLVVPGVLGTAAAGPLGVEPDEPAALPPDVVLGVGLGDAGAVATVTAGALPVAVSGEPRRPATETVAENWIVSPAGAVAGTLTCASICGVAGWSVGSGSSMVEPPGSPE